MEPPSLNGFKLRFQEEAKYLGLVLDRKLSWKRNTEERVRKATTALYTCKKAIGARWGLTPNITRWLYTAVVRPILLYGVLVWWPALDKVTYVKVLQRVQRSAALAISGALRTTSTETLEVLLMLMPLQLHGKQIAAISAARLNATSNWSQGQTGHASILSRLHIAAVNADYTIPEPIFEKRFKSLIPSREYWGKGENRRRGQISFYTDGSKLGGQVGLGVYSRELRLQISSRLPDHCSVFQAEVLAINTVVEWLARNVVSARHINIYSDSQAAIKSLKSTIQTSKVSRKCKISLNGISEHFKVRLVWVPGHSNVPGNCKADELARRGTTETITDKFINIGRPLATLKLAIKMRMMETWIQRWRDCTCSEAAKKIWPTPDHKRTKVLLSLPRVGVSTTVGIISGHCLIGIHAARLGVASNDFCRSCRDEEETESVSHLLCHCPALAQRRFRLLGSPFFRDTMELSSVSDRNIFRFARATWFGE